MNMFDLFNDENLDYYVPNNRFKFLREEDQCVTLGATNDLTLVSYLMEVDDVQDVQFIFKSGLDVVLVKNMKDIELTALGPDVYMHCLLESQDTIDLNLLREFKVQAKITLINGDIIYTRLLKLILLPTLQEQEEESEE